MTYNVFGGTLNPCSISSGNPENPEWKRLEKRFNGKSGNAVVRELVIAVL